MANWAEGILVEALAWKPDRFRVWENLLAGCAWAAECSHLLAASGLAQQLTHRQRHCNSPCSALVLRGVEALRVSESQKCLAPLKEESSVAATVKT